MDASAKPIALDPVLQDYARKIVPRLGGREQAIPLIKDTWQKVGRTLTGAEAEAIYDHAKALADEEEREAAEYLELHDAEAAESYGQAQSPAPPTVLALELPRKAIVARLVTWHASWPLEPR